MDQGSGVRRTGAVVAVVGTAAALALAAWLIPWQPVPGGAPPPVAADEVFTAAELARAEAYARGARAWSWSGLAASLVTLVVLAASARPGGRLRRLVDRAPGPRALRVAAAVVVVAVTTAAARLPFGLGAHRHRVEAGLSTQSWSAYLRDVGVGLAVETLVLVAALVGLSALTRMLPRAWPAAAGGLAAASTMLLTFVWPVLVEPLFNDFVPLPDGSLRSAVLAAAAEQGVDVEEVLVADASRRTTTLNAYVSGYGDTRRVVLYDTLVSGVPEDRVLAVAAHELAHARYDDPLVGTAVAAAGSAAGVGLLAVVLTAGRVRRGWGEPGSPAGVALVLALGLWGSVLAAPLSSGASRLVETRADVTALRTTGDADAFAALQRDLSLRSRSDPTPPAWAQWWFGTHPTALERIALARREAEHAQR